MTARRDFLKVGTAALIPAGPRHLEQARELVRSGALGRVGFCRIGDPSLLTAARSVAGLLRSRCIIELDPAFEGAAFLGSHATLVVTSAGCHVFPESA